MRASGAILRGLALLVLALWPAQAGVHLLPRQTATINVIGTSAWVVVSVPASALGAVDENHDRQLSAAEIGAHRAQIAAVFARGFQLASPQGRAVQRFAWVAPPQGDGSASDYVVVLGRYDFAAPPQQLTVDFALFGTRRDDQAQTVKATLRQAPGQPSEVAVLYPGLAQHTFFEGGLRRFAGYVGQGFNHIAGGADHLLFLLGLLLAGRGRRDWLAATLAFTCAHSITLALSAFDLARLSPALVEPGIAASIVLVAALALRSGPGQGGLRLTTVFACGLLHGLGFAAGLGNLLRPGADRLTMLAGFNLGIEAGQVAFVTLVLGGLALAVRLGGRAALPLGRRVLGWLTLGGGGILLVARLAAA